VIAGSGRAGGETEPGISQNEHGARRSTGLIVCGHLANNLRSIFMRTIPLVRAGRQTVCPPTQSTAARR